ncbi:MAG TPA: S41 family peptidase [Gemmatimonadaceae bacterium]|nr:S41 family peptidase [Gemmatimonadaceae bacterium]
MTIAARAFAFLVCCSSALSAQPVRAPLSAAAAQQDFDVLRRALEEAHGGLYRFVDKAELDRRLDEIRARLSQPVSKHEFASIIFETVAEIHDGHARVELDSLTASQLADARVLPLRVALEDDRLIVRFNDSPTDSLVRPGMEVISINGRSSESIIRALSFRVPRDGFIETGRRARIASGFPQLYWLFIEQTDSYTIVARDAAGHRTDITLAGIRERDRRSINNATNASLISHLSHLDAPPGNVSLEFLDKGQLARLKVRAFDGQTFPSVLDSAFRAIRERGTSGLILDLRGNGGGVDEYGALLLSYFVDHPFRYFDSIKVTTITPSFATWLPRTFESLRAGSEPDSRGGYRVTTALHPGVGIQQPQSHPYLGKLVVLVDGGSFSTTADVAAHLRSWRRAVFVGEETGGTYEGNTSGLNALIVLPNSRLRLKVMMYGYWNAVDRQATGRGVIPEHVVPARIVDLLGGRDRALEVASHLLR